MKKQSKSKRTQANKHNYNKITHQRYSQMQGEILMHDPTEEQQSQPSALKICSSKGKKDCITNIQWKWIKTEWNQSSTLLLLNENNSVRVTQTTKCFSQAVTQAALNSNLVYSVKCTFNKPLNGIGHIMVGLIPEEKINTNYFGDDNYCSFYSYPGLGPSEIIKGQLLNSDALKSTLTTILFKFCIKTQTFLLSDTTLQNISKLDKGKISPNIKYRFGIQFGYHVSDFSCLVSDVMSCKNQESAEKF